MRMISVAVSVAVFMGLLPARAAADRFKRIKHASSDNHYVTDKSTRLMWQGCPAPLTGENCDGTAEGYTWQQALDYCEGLDFGGYDDWRLPNRRELMSIVDDRKCFPAIDETAFPGTPSEYFWTSSYYVSSPTNPWNVSFDHGHTPGVIGDLTSANYVRCVRGGP